MVLAFAVLAIARLTGDGGTVATPSGGPSGAPSVAPSPTPRPTTSPSPPVSPSASPASSPAASTTPSAAPSAATYRVRPGDNLSSIAARFGTTVAVLVKLNDIKDPSLLRVGQVLKLP
jgi:LysM repeat protein